MDIQSQAKSNSRIEAIDICRAICMLSVIAGHVCQRYGTQHIMQLFYSFHMPLMFMISGYFINDKGDVRSFIISKVKRILIPYGFACCIIVIGQVVISAIRNQNVLHTAAKWIYVSLYGSGNSTGSNYIDLQGNIQQTDGVGMLWFLLALFWGSIILRLIITLKPKWSLLIALSCFAVGVFSVNLFWLPFSIQNGLVATLYMAGVLRQNNHTQTKGNVLVT